MMGVSILFVLFCHARQDGAAFSSSVLSFLSLGNLGVDMFFLFSGIGIYYSVSKSISNGTYSYSSFLIKRLKRVLIPYLIMETPFWVWYCVSNGFSPFHSLYYLSFASFWVEHIGLWFVALLLPLYIVSPWLLSLLQKNGCWITALIVLPLFISICPFHYLSEGVLHNIWDNIQIVSSRIPCYVIGLWLGKKVADSDRISLIWAFVLVLLFVLLKYVPVIKDIYRGWILAIVIAILLSVIFEKLSKKRTSVFTSFNNGIVVLGLSTLYIYIAYDVCKNLFPYLLNEASGTKYYLLTILAGIVIGLLYYYMEKFIKTRKKYIQ